MKTTFLHYSDDMEWLADKLLATGAKFAGMRSVILYGNEDCPEAVDLYRQENPRITDSFARIGFDTFPL